MREETTHSAEEGWQKSVQGQTKVTQKWTQGVEKRQAHQSQSRHKNRHMTNIYLTDSIEEAIVDFVKDPEELHDNTDEHFKDKAKEEVSVGEVHQ